jgi:general secretion pathway protein A
MYESFYGFRDNPFRLTPDPDYLFLSTNHQEALGHLLFGVREGGGVVVITGEIGAGKTTLLRTLVRNLDAQTTVAYIFNPALSSLELLQTINADLGLLSSSTSKKELTDELNHFLLAQQTAGRRTVVIVDEAQDLEPSVLEQLRLLSNLETERAKLLQIVLVGQPELAQTLARPDLAQLDQRVTLRWHLKPLPVDDTGGYIRHRLQVAGGGRAPVVFTPGAIRLVYQFSRGVPRLINVLCHRALLIAYTREERKIDSNIIRQAMKELRRHGQDTRQFLWGRSFALKAVAAVILLSTIGLLTTLATTRGWFFRKAEPQTQAAPDHDEGQGTSAATADTKSGLTEATMKSMADSSQVPLSQQILPDAHPVEEVLPPVIAPPGPHATTVTPPPAGTPPPGAGDEVLVEEFLRDVRNVSMVDSAVRATEGLLQAWKVEGLREKEWRRGTLDLTAIARARQLEYLPLTGSANLLSLLDLPMIMELVVPEVESTRFVLLLGLAGDRCRVFLDRERELPLRVLNDNWFGKGYVFWKDFEGIGAPLTVGSVGQNVRRLHMMLTQVQGAKELPLAVSGRENVFSRQTEEAIARFQRAKRLTPDGVAGPLTMILLYNSLATYVHPSLGGGTALTPKETPVALGGTAARVPAEERVPPYEHHS